MSDSKDRVIMALAEKLAICSRLLTLAAERQGWDRPEAFDLFDRLDAAVTALVVNQPEEVSSGRDI
jgi:hypothetical protein